MLPDPVYTKNFNPAEDAKYLRFTHQGVLSALATIFVRGDEVISTTQIPSSATIVAIVSERTSAVVQNTNTNDNEETVVLSKAPQANFTERDRGRPFPLTEYVQDGRRPLFKKLFDLDLFNQV